MTILKKILTILFLFAAMLTLLALTAVCAFKVAFPDEKIRKMLVDGGRGYLQREVSLERFSWGVRSGVEMAGLAVSEPGGFADGTFVSGKRITFTVELLPLLKRTLRVGTLSLESPKLRLVRYRDGSYNFSELLRAFDGHRREAPSAFRAAAPLPFFVAGLSVTDGALEFSQGPKGPSLLLKDIALSARKLSPLEPFEAELSFSAGGAKDPLAVRARLVLDPVKMQAEIREMVVTGGGASLNVTGTVSGSEGAGAPALDLSFKGDRAVLDRAIELFAPDAPLAFPSLPRVDLRLLGTPDNLEIKFAR